VEDVGETIVAVQRASRNGRRVAQLRVFGDAEGGRRMTSTMRPGEEKQSLAGEAIERAQDTARDVKGSTREQLRSQLAERSTQVGEQTASVAKAMRRASSQLREDGNDRVASAVDAFADRGQRLGEYLRTADGEKLLRDVEDFARRQPWLMVGGSAVVGFLGSRFMKASSQGRYQQSRNNGYPARDPASSTSQVPSLPTTSSAAASRGDVGAGLSGGSGSRGGE
jgi:ElaB/YqjD/DUF883 family membrane-anchored ribosome-binding protein